MLTLHDAIEPLDDARVHLRPARSGDEAALAAVLGDSSVATWWQVEDPTVDAALLAADPGIGLWLIEEEGSWHDGLLMDLLADELT